MSMKEEETREKGGGGRGRGKEKDLLYSRDPLTLARKGELIRWFRPGGGILYEGDGTC